jgi:hypothetical protein
MDSLIQLLGILVWPATVLIIVVIFHRPLAALVENVEKVEAPAGVKVFLNREKIEHVILQGEQEQVPAAEVANRIVQSAEVVDVSELRILRALFDEPEGRQIVNYARYYRAALDSLLQKGYVERDGKQYRLTVDGSEATSRYLRAALTR